MVITYRAEDLIEPGDLRIEFSQFRQNVLLSFVAWVLKPLRRL
jgi:hypothetical protein